MAIPVTCPACGRKYNLNDAMAGKRVRCKHCAEILTVPLDEVLPADAPLVATAAVQSEARPPVVPARRPPAEDEELLTVSPAPKQKGWSGTSVFLLCLFGGAGVLVLLVCAGVLVVIYQFIVTVDNVRQNVATQMNQTPANPNWPPPPPAPAERNVANALADLRAPDNRRRREAAEWLTKTAPNPAEQRNVAAALEPLLNDFDGFVRLAAANALVGWADAQSVPALVRCVERQDLAPGQQDAVLKALGRLKDPRGAAAVAKLLNDFRVRDKAAATLQTMGPVAEVEVAKCAFHQDASTRENANALLKGFGTKDDVLLTQALAADVKSPDVQRRYQAVLFLARTPLNPKRQKEVSLAVNPYLNSPDGNLQLAAVRTVKVWGTKENAPGLVQVLNTFYNHAMPPPTVKQTVLLAMEVLAGMKEEVALWPVAQYVIHQDPDESAAARKFVTELGAGVEPEVTKRIADPNPFTRERAWRVLGVIASKDSVPALQAALAKERHPFVRKAAQETVEAIAARP